MNPQLIATIGPVSRNKETLTELVKSGVNIARVNFSHATYENWTEIRTLLADIKKETGIEVKMMMDLQGPRIRIGNIAEPIQVTEGQSYILACGKPLQQVQGKLAANEIPVDYPNLWKDVKKGELIYIWNKSIELEVTKVAEKKIHVLAKNSGTVPPRKGINLPKTDLMIDVLGKKDIEDAKFGAAHGADYMCLSFVKEGKDIVRLRKIVGDKVKIIAKIEREFALKNIDSIIKESDGIMVARGDLGIEVPIEELAILQKELIRHAHQYKKPAIVATEMLASMSQKPIPTKAEAADVANAVFDGADAVMLSDETASGSYPVEAVKVMKKIAKRVDEYFNTTNYFHV